jgi:dienelactone hydrolase
MVARVVAHAARLASALLLAVLVAACATQPRDEVRVSVGTRPAYADAAKDYASLYLPYAMMATAAYSDPGVLNASFCPSEPLLADPARAQNSKQYAFYQAVRVWVHDLRRRGWHCQFGRYGALDCPKGLPNCRPAGGLEYHVWRRFSRRGCEVVIAFRGTDPDDLGDWRSNFRWLYRFSPRFDQYDQVRVHMDDIVRKAEAGGCGLGSMFVSTGHSLGGGLAQQAAYAHPRFSYVYAFDPSPVTGFFDISAAIRVANTKQLGIDRAYESGEVLSLPRHLIEGFFPPAACDPRVRIVRFNLLSGAPAAQHNMAGLTENFRAAAKGANGTRAAGNRAAAACGTRPSS